jgi:hypothetical protein
VSRYRSQKTALPNVDPWKVYVEEQPTVAAHRKAVQGVSPKALKSIAAGQKPVNATWIMFRAANALSAIVHAV